MNLYGASGHAKVIIDICNLNKEVISNIFDDDDKITSLLNNPVRPFEEKLTIQDKIIISVGNNLTRKKIANKIQSDFGRAIHPETIIDTTVTIGIGTVVMAGTVINSSARIGKHCIINTSSTIDHDCVLEDFVHISPNATVCGGIQIGEGTHIGAGATIIPNLKIGKWCTIGAGAVIIEDIPDNSTVVGNPGRVI